MTAITPDHIRYHVFYSEMSNQRHNDNKLLDGPMK